jgi:DNA-binding NarL/FixJ family response regulator
MITVLLADDQVLVRSGFRALIDAEDDMTCVAEAADGAEAVRLAATHHPDVVLMDIRMPGTDGLEATRQILRQPDSGTRVLVLTTFDLDEYVFEALRSGASGFLVKHTVPAELLRAIRVVAEGDALLSPGVTRRLIEHFANLEPSRPTARTDRLPLSALTPRELETVRLVAQGLSNDEIGRLWFVSPATVRTHVSRAMAKLHARDRAQLVVLAFQHGLANPDGTPEAPDPARER